MNARVFFHGISRPFRSSFGRCVYPIGISKRETKKNNVHVRLLLIARSRGRIIFDTFPMSGRFVKFDRKNRPPGQHIGNRPVPNTLRNVSFTMEVSIVTRADDLAATLFFHGRTAARRMKRAGRARSADKLTAWLIR